jgi:hypothetical protein
MATATARSRLEREIGDLTHGHSAPIVTTCYAMWMVLTGRGVQTAWQLVFRLTPRVELLLGNHRKGESEAG